MNVANQAIFTYYGFHWMIRGLTHRFNTNYEINYKIPGV